MNEIEIQEAKNDQISQTIEQRCDDIKEVIENLISLEDVKNYLGFPDTKIRGFSQKEKILEIESPDEEVFNVIEVNLLDYKGRCLPCNIKTKISFEDNSEINISINADLSINIYESKDGPMEVDSSSAEIDIQGIDYIETEDN